MQANKLGMTMSPQAIVQRSGKWRNLGISWQELYAAISTVLDGKEHRMLRSGNTLCLFEIVQPGVAVFNILSADNPKTLPARMTEFIKVFSKSGYKKLAFTTDEISELQALKNTGAQIRAQAVKGEDGETSYVAEIMMDQQGEDNAT